MQPVNKSRYTAGKSRRIPRKRGGFRVAVRGRPAVIKIDIVIPESSHAVRQHGLGDRLDLLLVAHVVPARLLAARLPRIPSQRRAPADAVVKRSSAR